MVCLEPAPDCKEDEDEEESEEFWKSVLNGTGPRRWYRRRDVPRKTAQDKLDEKKLRKTKQQSLIGKVRKISKEPTLQPTQKEDVSAETFLLSISFFRRLTTFQVGSSLQKNFQMTKMKGQIPSIQKKKLLMLMRNGRRRRN